VAPAGNFSDVFPDLNQRFRSYTSKAYRNVEFITVSLLRFENVLVTFILFPFGERVEIIIIITRTEIKTSPSKQRVQRYSIIASYRTNGGSERSETVVSLSRIYDSVGKLRYSYIRPRAVLGRVFFLFIISRVLGISRSANSIPSYCRRN